MSGLGTIENMFIGTVIGGFFYGIYSALFYMYIQRRASKEFDIDKRNIFLYALCTLYVLSTVTVALDVVLTLMSKEVFTGFSESILFRFHAVTYTGITISALCDFISQGILIYRCWVIWGHNIGVIIFPSILALAFLAIFLTINDNQAVQIAPLRLQYTHLGSALTITSLGISLTVNATVTGLIVLRILKTVYRQVGPTCENRTLGFGKAETKLRSIIFIIIESGMAMFTIQLIRVIFVIIPTSTDTGNLTLGIYQMFMGLTPTIILLRVSMGLSYHDEQSLVETAASWRFAPYNQNPVSETGDIEIAQE